MATTTVAVSTFVRLAKTEIILQMLTPYYLGSDGMTRDILLGCNGDRWREMLGGGFRKARPRRRGVEGGKHQILHQTVLVLWTKGAGV